MTRVVVIEIITVMVRKPKNWDYESDQLPAVLRCCHHGLVGGLLANDP